MKRLSLVLLVTFLGASNTVFAEDDLSKRTDEVIRSACHGYALDMIPDFLASIREQLKKDSSLCKDVREQGGDVDVQTTLKRHLTQRDLDRIYGKDWGDVGADEIAFECQNSYICGKMRKMLVKRKKSMSQKQYDQVAEYCRDDLAEYDCIKDWINREWLAKGTRKIPKRKLQDVGGLGLDNLIPPPKTGGATAAGNMDDLVGGSSAQFGEKVKAQPSRNNPVDAFTSLDNSSESHITQGEIGFDNIYAGRKQIKVNGIKQRLFNKGETIASRCQCAFRNDSCFKARSYDYKQLTSVLEETDKTLEVKKTEVCNNWKSALRGRTSDDETVLEIYLDNSNVILGNLNKLDKSYTTVLAKLNDKESEIKQEVERKRRAQAEQQEGGFNLAKFTALSAGFIIGGADAGLSDSDLVQLLAGAAADSMEGAEGIGNFNTAIQNITNQRVEQMRSVADINRQVAQIESSQKTVPKPPTIQAFSQVREPEPLGQSKGGFGAVALNFSTWSKKYGFVLNKASASAARSAALLACGNGCEVTDVFQTCAAVLMEIYPKSAPTRYVLTGATKREAETVGSGDCDFRARGGGGVLVV